MTIKRLVIYAITSIIGIFVILFSMTPSARSAGTVMLVTVGSINLAKNEFLQGLSIKTRNLRLLAICHIPPGWSLSVSSPAGSTGAIEAGAGGGVSSLGGNDLSELRAFFLIQISDTAHPEIVGTADIEVRGDQPDTSEIPLEASNFTMSPADQCPTTNSWGPTHR